MKSQILGLRVAGLLAGLICLGQLVRLVARIRIVVGSHPVPFWMSAIVMLVAGGLALWLWKLSLSEGGSAGAPSSSAV